MDKNSIILRILKRDMKVNKYAQFLDYTVLDSKAEVSELNFCGEEGYPFDDIYSIEVSDHAHKRWNTRVGPYLPKNQLKKCFNQLILLPHRIRKIREGIGIVDADIIFTYEKMGSKVVITTFYGRRSLNHSLYQIKALKGYNSFHNEQVILDSEEDILKVQNVPIIPMIFMRFCGVRTDYILEGYKVSGKELPVFLVHCVPGNSIEIDLNIKIQKRINKSILLALFKMRYRDFVWDYLQNYHKERIKSLEIKQFYFN